MKPQVMEAASDMNGENLHLAYSGARGVGSGFV